MWREEAKYEDMMYISYRVTGGVKGLYTALNNPNGHNCMGTGCDGDLVRSKVETKNGNWVDLQNVT